MERISLDCSGDENTIATAIQRWINLYLDSGRLMGVALTRSSRVWRTVTHDEHDGEDEDGPQDVAHWHW
jgi:hypothetical protein